MKITLEKILKGTLVTGFMVKSFLLPSVGLLPTKANYLNAQTTQTTTNQEKNKEKKKEEPEFYNLKKELKELEASEKKVNQNSAQFLIQPLDVMINGEYKQLKDQDILRMPYDANFYINPQTKNGFVTEFLIRLSNKNTILNDLYQTDNSGYICDRLGNRVKCVNQTIRFQDYGLRPGDQLIPEVTYETSTKLFQTAQLLVELVPGEEGMSEGTSGTQSETQTGVTEPYKPNPVQMQNTPNPRGAIDDLRSRMVSQPQSGSQKEAKSKSKGPTIIIPKFGYVLDTETSNTDGTDPGSQRTGAGFLIEAEYAKSKLDAWLTVLTKTYDNKIRAFGGSTIEETFTDADLGAEFKIGSPDGLGLVTGFNLISTNKRWVPTRTPLFIPYEMNNYNFKGAYAGAGLVLGQFDKNFIAGMIYGGYGKVVEGTNMPGESFVADVFKDSYSFADWFYKVHGRLELDPFLLEGGWTSGKSINKNIGLSRTSESLSGKALVSLGVISDSLNNLYIGAFVNKFTSTDSAKPKMKFDDLSWGPIVIWKIPYK